MIVDKIEFVTRKIDRDGVKRFHFEDGTKVEAYKHGEGVGVDVMFRVSQIDVDCGLSEGQASNLTRVTFHWFPSATELRQIADMLDQSQVKTFDLLGHGWKHGTRPYNGTEISQFV